MHVLRHNTQLLTTTSMVSLENFQTSSIPMEGISSPRISFSCDFLDDKSFISLNPNSCTEKFLDNERDKACNMDFEFLSTDSATDTMLTADELFFDGKLLPFWKMQQLDKLNKVNVRPKVGDEKENKEPSMEDRRVSWFIDEDPSPRPPKCTLLWKELLRMKKQRASSLSPSSSTSSSSSSSSSDSNVHTGSADASKVSKESIWNREKHVKRIKQGLERTRSASIRVRPVVNVPSVGQGKSGLLHPLFSLKKGNVER